MQNAQKYLEIISMVYWRAVCVERRKHGSEGGGWKSARNGNSLAAYPTKPGAKAAIA